MLFGDRIHLRAIRQRHMREVYLIGIGMLLAKHFGGLVVLRLKKIINIMKLKPVMPGDQLRFELSMTAFRRNTCKMSGVAYVDDVEVASADFMAMVVDR